jgi:hypothetical protein
VPTPSCFRRATRLLVLAGLLAGALTAGAGCNTRTESYGMLADTLDRPLPLTATRPGETPRTGTQRGLRPPTLPSAPFADWVTLRGDGFTLRYPPEATLQADSTFPDALPGTAIRGPMIVVRSPDVEVGTHTGPAYQMLVVSAPNPAGTSVQRWVDSVRRARNARVGDDPDTLAQHGPPVAVSVGDERALMLLPFCGDCEVMELYLASRDRRVLVSMVYDLSIPGDRESQRQLYEAILGTFRWTP